MEPKRKQISQPQRRVGRTGNSGVVRRAGGGRSDATRGSVGGDGVAPVRRATRNGDMGRGNFAVRNKSLAGNDLRRGGEPRGARRLKVPEALPDERIKESAFDKIKSAVFRKRVAIQEIIREPTSGGIVFRFTKDKKDIEILLIQDSKERWTIPKGHIEVGETAKMTARREIEEETGLMNISVRSWLGKIHFKYRRADKLVLMTTQVYLVEALDEHERPTPEKWMKGIQWFSFVKALDTVEYEDIEKLMLIAKKKIRAGDY